MTDEQLAQELAELTLALLEDHYGDTSVVAELLLPLVRDSARLKWLCDASGSWWEREGYAGCMTGRLIEEIDLARAEQEEGS